MVKTLQVFFILLVVGMTGMWVEAKAVGKNVPVTPSASVSATLVPTAGVTPQVGDSQLKLSAEDVSRLEKILDTQVIGKWNGINTFRKFERIAISKGVRADTIVLLLLLPLIATLVSVLHYMFGVNGGMEFLHQP